MRADGQGFDKGELVESKASTMDEGGTRHAQIFHHTAVYVYAADFYTRAAIGFSVAAGDTMSAVEVRDDCHGLAWLEAWGLIEVDEIAGQLVAEDTGIFKIGLCAFEGMQVGAADADAFYFYDAVTWFCQGRVGFAVSKIARFYANKCLHIMRWLRPGRDGHSHHRHG